MKRTTTIVLFASIFAVAVGTLGISGNSALLMASATSQSSEPIGMLGHVEYMVRDFDGNIVSYMQNDNVVVTDGKDCVADTIFGATVVDCVNALPFNYIGIGNGSSIATGEGNQTLADGSNAEIDDEGQCAVTGAAGTLGGDMARKQVAATAVAAIPGTPGTGAVVTLDTSTDPFTFTTSNATTVIDSGIFNADYDTPGADRICGGTNNAAVDWDMFSRQLLNGATGITVSQGDSLSVKWTITVG